MTVTRTTYSSSAFWDERYAHDDLRYGAAPNAYLRQWTHLLPARAEVLVPADGEGRNGVYLAGLGHAVTTFDASARGVAKAQALAESMGVALQQVHADTSSFDWQPEAFDGVVLSFFHMASDMRRVVHVNCIAALRPGGVVILNAFNPAQLAHASGGPKDAAMLFTVDALTQDFGSACEIIDLGTYAATLDEGPGHQGPAALIGMVARKR